MKEQTLDAYLEPLFTTTSTTKSQAKIGLVLCFARQ